MLLNFTDNESTGSKLSRKRTRNPTSHLAHIKKQKVQKGEEHQTSSGKIVKGKVFQAQVTCKCSRKCPQHINSDRQEEIFNCFYNLENWTQKTLFLRTLSKTERVKENLNAIINLKKRNTHTQYYLSDKTEMQQKVCMIFVLNCLQINRSRMFYAINTVTANENAKETRGIFPNRKTNENDIAFVKNFINSLPTYESHYSNKSIHSNKKYLSPFLTIKRIYSEYCLKSKFKRKKPVSQWKFRHIFNTEFNLSFARLKVDTCRKCDMFKAISQSQSQGSVQRTQSEPGFA